MSKKLLPPSKRRKANSKKANAHKLRVIENAKKVLNGISICCSYSADEKQKHVLIFQGGNPVKTSATLSESLDVLRCKWDVTCGVFCRNQKGKHYALYCNFRFKDEVTGTSEILRQITVDVCYQMFYEIAPKLERLCPFWIGTPRSNQGENDLNLAIKTAHFFKVFNELGTDFEINCNMPVIDYHKGKQWYDLALDFRWEEVELDLSEYI